MADVLEIKDIPDSPNTSLEITDIFNPLLTDFTHPWGGQPYTIPSRETAQFPEFLARHLAKHLAMKIVRGNFYEEVEDAARGQLTPDSAKSLPSNRQDVMLEWLLSPVGDSPEQGRGGKPKPEEVQAKKEDNLVKARAAKAAKKTTSKKAAN